MDKVNSSLAATGGTDRSAYFNCTLALYWPDGHHTKSLMVNRWSTCLCRGHNGFGYDPYSLRQDEQTFGEMDPQEKLDIGHRARAFLNLSTPVCMMAEGLCALRSGRSVAPNALTAISIHM